MLQEVYFAFENIFEIVFKPLFQSKRIINHLHFRYLIINFNSGRLKIYNFLMYLIIFNIPILISKQSKKIFSTVATFLSKLKILLISTGNLVGKYSKRSNHRSNSIFCKCSV